MTARISTLALQSFGSRNERTIGVVRLVSGQMPQSDVRPVSNFKRLPPGAFVTDTKRRQCKAGGCNARHVKRPAGGRAAISSRAIKHQAGLGSACSQKYLNARRFQVFKKHLVLLLQTLQVQRRRPVRCECRGRSLQEYAS